ncbi:hypothetical protein VCHC51A1_1186, partial [Vibrio cholerae HC-51A1]
MKLQPLWLEIS